MKRPSKKDIKAAVEKLKQKPEGQGELPEPPSAGGKLQPKKSSQRIRKQGV